MPPTHPTRKPRVMAVASGGGHWVQLLRLRPALEGFDLAFVTVREGYRADVDGERFYTMPDCNIQTRLGMLRSAFSILWILLRERPEVVISTGAAPGYFAIHFGKWLGARTIWIDSIANVEELSLSGRKVGKYADLWLTQWPHLVQAGGPHFQGNVL